MFLQRMNGNGKLKSDMKSTELMIGDFVFVDNNPTKVAQVTKHKIGYHKGGGAFEMCTMSYSRSCEINPIPLTPEILEKNGFRCYGDNWGYGAFIFAVRGEYFIGSVCCETFFIKYVHKLQHALRLCGLEELATNFKV